jgi:endonuclease/exonuclease/phosphatase family metal-dependent hydrolase
VPPEVKDPNVALRAVRSLVEFIAEPSGPAIDLSGRSILAGDFNAPPDSDEIRLLTGRRSPPRPGWVFLDAWETAGDGSPGYTMSRTNPNAAPLLLPDVRWDYIFVHWPSGRPGGVGHPLHAEVVGVEARDGVVPSDHYAVVADLRY